MIDQKAKGLSDLESIFFGSAHHPCQKWGHYFEIYERYFSRFRNKRLTFVEIGVGRAGSLDIWKKYFGDRATIIGVCVDPNSRRFESASAQIIVGDQDDPAFIASLSEQVGEPDIILDSGGRGGDQQILTFEQLYKRLKEGGVYMCEDIHTSYYQSYGNDVASSRTFIEYLKRGVDDLHGWYTTPSPSSDSLSRSTRAISFYNSVVVVEKQRFSGPIRVDVGYNRPNP